MQVGGFAAAQLNAFIDVYKWMEDTPDRRQEVEDIQDKNREDREGDVSFSAFRVFNVNDIYTELRKQEQNPAARAAVKHLREDGYGSSSDDDEGQGDLTPLGNHPDTPCDDDDDQPTPKSPSVAPGENEDNLVVDDKCFGRFGGVQLTGSGPPR